MRKITHFSYPSLSKIKNFVSIVCLKFAPLYHVLDTVDYTYNEPSKGLKKVCCIQSFFVTQFTNLCTSNLHQIGT